MRTRSCECVAFADDLCSSESSLFLNIVSIQNNKKTKQTLTSCKIENIVFKAEVSTRMKKVLRSAQKR